MHTSSPTSPSSPSFSSSLPSSSSSSFHNQVYQKLIFCLRTSSYARRRALVPFVLFFLLFLVVFFSSVDYYYETDFTSSSSSSSFSTSSNHPSSSPFDASTKFLTFQPYDGGFNNRRIQFESQVFLAMLLKRTLILPPSPPFVDVHSISKKKEKMKKKSVNKQKKKKQGEERMLTPQDVYDFEILRKGVPLVTTEEFEERGGWNLLKDKEGFHLPQTSSSSSPSSSSSSASSSFLGHLFWWIFKKRSHLAEPARVCSTANFNNGGDVESRKLQEGDVSRKSERFKWNCNKMKTFAQRSEKLRYGLNEYFTLKSEDEQENDSSSFLKSDPRRQGRKPIDLSPFCSSRSSSPTLVFDDSEEGFRVFSNLVYFNTSTNKRARHVLGKMKTLLSYKPELHHLADLTVEALGGASNFAALHIRRGDYKKMFPHFVDDPASILVKFRPLWQKEKESTSTATTPAGLKKILIASNEEDEVEELLRPFLSSSTVSSTSSSSSSSSSSCLVPEGIEILQWSTLEKRQPLLRDRIQSSLSSTNENLKPLLVQLVLARSKYFIANPMSSLSSYVVRLRGYAGLSERTFYSNFGFTLTPSSSPPLHHLHLPVHDDQQQHEHYEIRPVPEIVEVMNQNVHESNLGWQGILKHW